MACVCSETGKKGREFDFPTFLHVIRRFQYVNRNSTKTRVAERVLGGDGRALGTVVGDIDTRADWATLRRGALYDGVDGG